MPYCLNERDELLISSSVPLSRRFGLELMHYFDVGMLLLQSQGECLTNAEDAAHVQMIELSRGGGDQLLYAPFTEVGAAKQVEELEVWAVLTKFGQCAVLDSGTEAEADIAEEGAAGGELGGRGIIDLIAAIQGNVSQLRATVC